MSAGNSRTTPHPTGPPTTERGQYQLLNRTTNIEQPILFKRAKIFSVLGIFALILYLILLSRRPTNDVDNDRSGNKSSLPESVNDGSNSSPVSEETTNHTPDSDAAATGDIFELISQPEDTNHGDKPEESGETSGQPNSPHRENIRDLNINQTTIFKISSTAQSHPRLVFIKGLKVGGTSVAYALNRAAAQYHITLAGVPMQANLNLHHMNCVQVKQGTLYFHHGFRNDWQTHCIKNVRFVTILREPISQTLSWETMALNRLYFLQYPSHNCATNKVAPITAMKTNELAKMLSSVENCVDTAFRRNVTMMMVAHRVGNFPISNSSETNGYPGDAVASTAKWILPAKSYGQVNAEEIINVLKNQYFLVGVTERLNEFLVLLAIVNGWDLQSIYYRKCKPTNLDIHRNEFAKQFPDMIPRLEHSIKPMKVAYEWAKNNFDEFVNSLGPWFPRLVERYENGLEKFQKAHNGRSFRWSYMQYLDGEFEYC